MKWNEMKCKKKKRKKKKFNIDKKWNKNIHIHWKKNEWKYWSEIKILNLCIYSNYAFIYTEQKNVLTQGWAKRFERNKGDMLFSSENSLLKWSFCLQHNRCYQNIKFLIMTKMMFSMHNRVKIHPFWSTMNSTISHMPAKLKIQLPFMYFSLYYFNFPYRIRFTNPCSLKMYKFINV